MIGEVGWVRLVIGEAGLINCGGLDTMGLVSAVVG